MFLFGLFQEYDPILRLKGRPESIKIGFEERNTYHAHRPNDFTEFYKYEAEG